MPLTVDIDPCPYCKSAAVHLGWGQASTMPVFYYAACRSCGCMGSIGTTRAEAADKWRQGPKDTRSWFGHLDGETRH